MLASIPYIGAVLAAADMTICLAGWVQWKQYGKSRMRLQIWLAAISFVILLMMFGLIWWMAAASAPA
ncbi:MAG: hypothetical protein HND27_11115 [Bacteroidetes bacterium]|nr:hypothetical protein [Phycisphaerales bacterium]NOG96312.1 hypothetical protein [Bacteroidota bacterium]